MTTMKPIVMIFNMRRNVYQTLGLKLFKHIPYLYGIHLLPIITNHNDGVQQRALQINRKMPIYLNSIKRDKIHLVGYSLSGIDCRYALSQLKIKQYCHTLTTICSPHLGSKSALLSEKNIFNNITMDPITRLLGVSIKSFHEVVPENMSNFNKYIQNLDSIDYYSIGAERSPNYCYESFRQLAMYLRLKSIPNFTYENDGIFGHDEIIWGEHLINMEADHSEIIGIGEYDEQSQKEQEKLKQHNNCFDVILENIQDWKDQSITVE